MFINIFRKNKNIQKNLLEAINNRCGFYIMAWILYYLQGIVYPRGGIISKFALIFFMLTSFYTTFKLVKTSKLNGYIKNLWLLLLMFTFYGIVYIISGIQYKIDGTPYAQTEYLKFIYFSILPIFSFSYFFKTGKLTTRGIEAFIPIFLFVIIAKYFYVQVSRLEIVIENGGSSEAEITNNAAYYFLSLIPLLPLCKSLIERYLYLIIVVLFIFMGMKRGCILIGVCATIYLVKNTIKNASSKIRNSAIFISIFFLCISIYYLSIFIESSDYFQHRLESTLSGDSNGRSDLIGILWKHYIDDSTIIEQLLGNGADATLAIAGNFAHNDWIELLTNQGLLGVAFYAAYWYSFYKLCTKSKPYNQEHMILVLAFFVCFAKTLFSMSYGDMDIFLGIAIAYASSNVYSRRYI